MVYQKWLNIGLLTSQTLSIMTLIQTSRYRFIVNYKFKPIQMSIKAIPFVKLADNSNHSSTAYSLHPQAAQLIQHLNKGFAIVTIIGPYRSGKSTLLNTILEKQVFETKSTINAQTKGLELYHYRNGLKDILFLDCEGIGSLEGNCKNDVNLCVIAVLASSLLIYNSVGVLDQSAFQYLEVIINSVKRYKGREFVPDLIWILRDFMLQLIDEQGRSITQDNYLDSCLNQTEEFNQKTAEKNRLRKTIKEFFKKRSCRTLVRPILNQESLQNMCLRYENIRPQFREKVNLIRKEIIDSSVKKVNNTELSPLMYVQYLRELCKELSKSKISNLGNIWDMVMANNNHMLLMRCSQNIDRLVSEIILPQQSQAIEQKFRLIKKDQKAYFQSNKLGQQKETSQLNELNKYIESRKKQLIRQNDKLCKQTVEKILNVQYSKIEQQIGSFQMEEYFKQLEIFQKYQENNMPKFDCVGVVLMQFLKKKMFLFMHKYKDYIKEKEILLSKKEKEFERMKDLIKECDQIILKNQTFFQENTNLKEALALAQHKANFYENEAREKSEKLLLLEEKMYSMKEMYQNKLNSKVDELEERNREIKKQLLRIEEGEKELEKCKNEKKKEVKSQEQILMESKFYQSDKRASEFKKTIKILEQKCEMLEMNEKIKEKQYNLRQKQLGEEKMKLLEIIKDERCSSGEKDIFYQKQLQKLKAQIQKTKQSYQNTLITIRGNSRILQRLQNNQNAFSQLNRVKQEANRVMKCMSELQELDQSNEIFLNTERKYQKEKSMREIIEQNLLFRKQLEQSYEENKMNSQQEKENQFMKRRTSGKLY